MLCLALICKYIQPSCAALVAQLEEHSSREKNVVVSSPKAADISGKQAFLSCHEVVLCYILCLEGVSMHV